jgi:prepilin-type processing-associated H-X9-DG protein
MAIRLTCPQCGNVTEAAEQYAGQTVRCTKCAATIAIPPPDGDSPIRGPGAPKKQGLGTGEIILIMAAVAVVLLLLCWTVILPALAEAIIAKKKMPCINNLKQISFALHNYHNTYGTFPPAYIPDKNGRPMHSWRVLILPFLQNGDLYKQYHFDEPWNSPNNRKVADVAMGVFHCPNESDPNAHTTSYMMVVGPHTISDGPHGRKLSQITDGAANTIMLVEVANSGVGWAEPRDLSFEDMDFKINGIKRHSISSCHSGGASVAFCDGSVCFLTDTIYPQTVKSMLTIDGGEQSSVGLR